MPRPKSTPQFAQWLKRLKLEDLQKLAERASLPQGGSKAVLQSALKEFVGGPASLPTSPLGAAGGSSLDHCNTSSDSTIAGSPSEAGRALATLTRGTGTPGDSKELPIVTDADDVIPPWLLKLFPAIKRGLAASPDVSPALKTPDKELPDEEPEAFGLRLHRALEYTDEDCEDAGEAACFADLEKTKESILQLFSTHEALRAGGAASSQLPAASTGTAAAARASAATAAATTIWRRAQRR
mmetsp:Transcript_63635/g.132491  ORF Transcript_63635/g.132491 Transcript_63635/m.132491 type:complete len:240 (+) Transcript_63635:521-1240(+)